MKFPTCFLLLLLVSVTSNAQNDLDPNKKTSGYDLVYSTRPRVRERTKRNYNRYDIPFEYKNNLMVVNLVFNGVFPLEFIFDTGAEHTIFSKKKITDLLGIKYHRKFTIYGSDMNVKLIAYLVRGIQLKIADLTLSNHSMLVLEKDYFHFEEIAGMTIHGILGSDVFRSFIVKIDFKKNQISLFKPKSFKENLKKYEKIPIEIFKHKPYITATTRFPNDSTLQLKLLLDTGASIPLLLHTNTDRRMVLPDNLIRGNIGMGLGGFLEGAVGRINELKIGSFNLKNVITNFRDLPEDADTTLLFNRNGILGNQILSRFSIIIDYQKQMLYLKPYKNLDEAFEFDKSGIFVVAGGHKLNTYFIHEVIQDSPAWKAGIRKGDRIKKLKGMPAQLFSLRHIGNILSKKEGKKVKMVIIRKGERLKVAFRLRKLI